MIRSLNTNSLELHLTKATGNARRETEGPSSREKNEQKTRGPGIAPKNLGLRLSQKMLGLGLGLGFSSSEKENLEGKQEIYLGTTHLNYR